MRRSHVCGPVYCLLDVDISAANIDDQDLGDHEAGYRPCVSVNDAGVPLFPFVDLDDATQESWNDAVGDNWSSEGQGDTYIVSKMDVYFHGISRVENAGSQTGSNESVSEAI